jgi:hypothetical protein
MSTPAKSPERTSDSMRPPSIWTNNSSVFADSAISIGASTPKFIHADDRLEMQSDSSESSQPTISERLNNLAASAFAVEDDGCLDTAKDQKIREALRVIEACLGNRGHEQDEEEAQEQTADVTEGTEDSLEEIQLHEIHASLAATVASMRQQQEEQRHLHTLTMQKLEAVAQRCVAQQKQLRDLSRDVQDLREENQKLGQENDTLRGRIADLESQANQKEVAVTAMSSAVAGLEGFINNSPGGDRYHTQSARQTPRRGRIVVRGQGRFRGRYFVDDSSGEVVLNGRESPSDTEDLHDGIRSWLKGFRDVEEELQRATPVKRRASKVTRSEFMSTSDDWGEFETVSGT